MSDREPSQVEDLFNENDDDDLGLASASDDEKPAVVGAANGGAEDEADADDDANQQLKVLEISLPRHSVADTMDADVYTLKMPVFLSLDAHPFDPVDFKDQVARNAEQRKTQFADARSITNDSLREKLLNESTIRWRYTNVNEEIVKQSNAHFVEWDDGSLSLKIGNEMFDFKDIPLQDNVLVKSHDALEILQADSILSRSVNLLPASTLTSTHQQLSYAVKNIQRKDKILNTITDRDPMEMQRLADENERKALKLRRQLDMKRRLQEERVGQITTRGGRDDYEEDEPAYERFNRTYGNDDYDEEDDFIDDDDEEEEEDDDAKAARLSNIKSEGASKYQQQADDDDVGDGEEEAGRKRRRIIDSDDEEE